MQTLPPATELRELSEKERERVLDNLFEPSPALHSFAGDFLTAEGVSSYDDVIDAIGKSLHALANSSFQSDMQLLHSILSSHPRLGASRVESSHSQAEQSSLQTGDRREAFVLAELNESYERAFPGLRYVTFVNGRPRSVIMQDMTARIQRRDQKQEEIDAINAMCDIAKDRARNLTN